MINQKESELINGFLVEYKNRLSNDGCNDWKFPEVWTNFEKQEFVKTYHAWNGYPEEYNPKRLSLPNFAVVSFLAYKLTKKDNGYSIKIKNINYVKEDWVLGYLTEEQQNDIVSIGAHQPGPYIVSFGYTGIGMTVKVFNENEVLLLDLTNYDSW